MSNKVGGGGGGAWHSSSGRLFTLILNRLLVFNTFFVTTSNFGGGLLNFVRLIATSGATCYTVLLINAMTYMTYVVRSPYTIVTNPQEVYSCEKSY